MAEIVVFVDDVVRGTLPRVCAKDGVPTTDCLTMRHDLSAPAGLGLAWLLLLAGPLGWLGLVLVASARGSRAEILTVQIPLSEAAYQRRLAARGLRRRALAVGAVGSLIVLLNLRGLGSPGRLALVGVVAAAVLVALGAHLLAERRLRAEQVDVELDASRRWVTLRRVHPAFVQACLDAERRRRAEGLGHRGP